jgi:hypothetical protein
MMTTTLRYEALNGGDYIGPVSRAMLWCFTGRQEPIVHPRLTMQHIVSKAVHYWNPFFILQKAPVTSAQRGIQ